VGPLPGNGCCGLRSRQRGQRGDAAYEGGLVKPLLVVDRSSRTASLNACIWYLVLGRRIAQRCRHLGPFTRRMSATPSRERRGRLALTGTRMALEVADTATGALTPPTREPSRCGGFRASGTSIVARELAKFAFAGLGTAMLQSGAAPRHSLGLPSLSVANLTTRGRLEDPRYL
jgi:hypothetical protein